MKIVNVKNLGQLLFILAMNFVAKKDKKIKLSINFIYEIFVLANNYVTSVLYILEEK